MTLDKVNNRLFVEQHGNSRYDIYQLDDAGLPLRRHADQGIGRSLIGRGFTFAPMNTTALTNPGGGSFDSVHQRMFLSDDLSLGPPAARILVFDLSPETVSSLGRNELPQAIAVLGQPDFDTYEPGSCLMFACAGVLTSFVSITPGGLGIREFLIGALALATGFELRDAVIASTLARLGEMAAVFALGGFFSHRLARRALDPQ